MGRERRNEFAESGVNPAEVPAEERVSDGAMVLAGAGAETMGRGGLGEEVEPLRYGSSGIVGGTLGCVLVYEMWLVVGPVNELVGPVNELVGPVNELAGAAIDERDGGGMAATAELLE